jgi:Fe2+ or Zn2+ uptake regulation protein
MRMSEKRLTKPTRALRARQHLKQTLSTGGFHFTEQRAAVFAYLSQVAHHPTAEEVYLAVKQQLPKVSLATVYKNLEALIESGVASKLTYGDSSTRYDIRTDHHHHLRCVACGKIWDVEPKEGSDWLKTLKPRPGFQVTDFRLEILGHCRDCWKERNIANK